MSHSEKPQPLDQSGSRPCSAWLGKQIRATQERIKTYPEWLQRLMEIDCQRLKESGKPDPDEYPKWLERKFGNY